MDKIFINKLFNKSYNIWDTIYWVANCFDSANICYAHGADNPWDEAKQLVLSSICLPFKHANNVIHTRSLNYREKHLITKRVIRRINEHIPVAYLTNKAYFCNHIFYVDERVIIPRSPIGELINNNFNGLINNQPNYILDMCTGSGCIAIACAFIFSNAKIDAVDISIDALTVAKFNIKKHNLAHRITPIYSDLFYKLPKIKYDLIVTNPPYVNFTDMLNLPDEHRYEPIIGLESGNDGLKLTNRILTHASDYLSDCGILICEVGNSMSNLIKKFPNIPFIWLEFNNGGNGVFMLTKKQLISYRKYFNFY